MSDEPWVMSSTSFAAMARLTAQRQLAIMKDIAAAKLDGQMQSAAIHPVSSLDQCRCQEVGRPWDRCLQRATAEDLRCDDCRDSHPEPQWAVVL